ncbi:peptidase S8/S53 domain-containing protein [Cokeromyces recurvatus]|uniref:peptidase S8/S53 domain-containing protein n=1 Tax=Cokeromyces recurvatus TaxID=90255 RepID=UPI0022209CD1|nr:peptidase S8/S53 domain-containing protein [Cokeromyces recurvatus]KAI7902679.1 peptidase S8/S53 domain-containing protein [Cokeromyces recurvatus]
MSLNQINIGKGFVAVAGVFSDSDFLEYLHKNSAIDYVEQNQIYKSTAVPNQETIIHSHPNITMLTKRTMNRRDSTTIKSTKSANWGLARINQHSKGDLTKYTFDSLGGIGIDVFILDTGVYPQHEDFEGRAYQSINLVMNEAIDDIGGHGTHVAGKVIGRDYGVAKNAQIKAVKILNKMGDGSTSGLLRGIEYVIQNARPGKSVVNLSLSGPKSKMIDDALNSLVLEYNIPIFVSAGNSGTDACFYSPSSNPNVFTVGATDINDIVPPFSNVGQCVDIYAPGVNITSSYITDRMAFISMDGTSMASPHVAGVAANLMSKKDYQSAHEVYSDIKELATRNALSFDYVRSTSPNNNLLAFNQVTN